MDTPKTLIQKAQRHDAKAVELRTKAARLSNQRANLERRIAELVARAKKLDARAASHLSMAVEHEAAEADLLDEARLLYTANMEGTSEELRAVWQNFFKGEIA